MVYTCQSQIHNLSSSPYSSPPPVTVNLSSVSFYFVNKFICIIFLNSTPKWLSYLPFSVLYWLSIILALFWNCSNNPLFNPHSIPVRQGFSTRDEVSERRRVVLLTDALLFCSLPGIPCIEVSSLWLGSKFNVF